MSTKTKRQVLARLRRCYTTAGREHKRQLLNQAVEPLGYHRKAVLRALGAPPAPPRAPALLLRRPKMVRLPAMLVRQARRLVVRVKVAVSWLGWWAAWAARWWGRTETVGTAAVLGPSG